MRTRGVSKDRRGKGLSAWGQSSKFRTVFAFCLGTVATDGFVDAMAFWKVAFLSGIILNRRSMEIGAGSVSLRKKKVTSQAIRENVAGIAQGRK